MLVALTHFLKTEESTIKKDIFTDYAHHDIPMINLLYITFSPTVKGSEFQIFITLGIKSSFYQCLIFISVYTC